MRATAATVDVQGPFSVEGWPQPERSLSPQVLANHARELRARFGARETVAVTTSTTAIPRCLIGHAEQALDVLDQDVRSQLIVRHEPRQGIQQQTVIRHAGRVEYARVRPIASP